MKFRIYLKDPDGINDAVNTATHDSLNKIRMELANEQEYLKVSELRKDLINEFLSKWIDGAGDYVMLEFDTDSNSCRVVPVDELHGKEPNFGYIDSFVKGK